MKINQTINDALIHLGVIDATEEPAPEDSQFALRLLNRILDGYNTMNLTIPYSKYITYPNDSWTSSSIEIGNGKEVDADAPQDITQVLFRDDTIDSIDYICTPMTQTEYAAITYKGVIAIPTKYYTQQTESGVTTIYLNCIPQAGLKLVTYAKEKYRTDFKPTDDVDWGTGVEKMLVLRLAVELSSSYHIQPDQVLMFAAGEAENTVKAYNYQPQALKSSRTLTRRKYSRYNPARI